MKSKFLTKLKDVNENAQAQGKNMHSALLNFFSSVFFMLFCAAQERMILLNNIIFMKLNQTCAFETQKLLLRIEFFLFEF